MKINNVCPLFSTHIEVQLDGGDDENGLIVNVVDQPGIPVYIPPISKSGLFNSDEFVFVDPNVLLTSDTDYQTGINGIVNQILSVNVDNILINVNSGFVGELVVNPIFGQMTVTSDPDYSFNYPRTTRYPELAVVGDFVYKNGDKKETKPKLDANLVEKLRYSYAEFVLTDSFIQINVMSYVNPIRSRLDQKVDSGKLSALKLFTSYGANGEDPDSDSTYVDLGSTKIPSYNPVLAAFRSFGLLEAIRDNILTSASALAKTPAEIADITSKFDTALNAAVIFADNPSDLSTVRGLAKDVEYSDYQFFKP